MGGGGTESTIRKVIFIVLFLKALPISSGLNYTLFRFIMPYMALFCLIQCGNKTHPVLYSVLLCFLTSLIINISPEIGIAFSVTLIISNLVKAFLDKKLSNVVYGAVSLLSAAVWFAVMPGMLTQLESFLAGGLNWPFVVSFDLIFFFLLLFFFSINIGLQLNNLRQNFNLLTLELLACGMLPGALGRCDPGHLFWNGLFVFIITGAFLRKTKWKKAYAAAMVLFYFLSFPFLIMAHGQIYASAMMNNHVIGHFFYSDAGQSLVRSVAKAFGVDEKKVSARLARGLERKIPQGLENISDIAMPFDGDNAIYVYLGDNKRYHYLPCKSMAAVGSEKVVVQMLNALKKEKPRYLLLPEDWEKCIEPAEYVKDIQMLFVTVFTRERLYNGNEIYRDIFSCIKNAYRFVSKIGSSCDLYELK